MRFLRVRLWPKKKKKHCIRTLSIRWSGDDAHVWSIGQKNTQGWEVEKPTLRKTNHREWPGRRQGGWNSPPSKQTCPSKLSRFLVMEDPKISNMETMEGGWDYSILIHCLPMTFTNLVNIPAVSSLWCHVTQLPWFAVSTPGQWEASQGRTKPSCISEVSAITTTLDIQAHTYHQGCGHSHSPRAVMSLRCMADAEEWAVLVQIQTHHQVPGAASMPQLYKT